MILITVVLAVSALILTPVLYWFYILFKNRRMHEIPGPTPTMILGNIFVKDAYELHDYFLKIHDDYGPTVRIYTGPYINVVLSKPEHIQAILTSTEHLSKSLGYSLLRPWLGEGLLVSEAKKWKIRRKLLNPSFHFKILEEFKHTFNSAGEVLIEQLSNEVGKESVDMFQFMHLYGLDVICETAMGVIINAQTDHNHLYPVTVKKFLEIAMWRFFSGWALFDFPFWLFANNTYRKYKAYIKILHEFTNGIIEKRRKEYKEIAKNGADKEIDESRTKSKKALLDFLLTCEEANGLSNEDIREEIDTFMFAGHDTVTSAMALTLLELSRNPEVQNELYEEIKLFTENNNMELTSNILNEMKYLDMVIKEGLRKYPPVPMVQRKIETGCYIDGIKYEKGTIAALHINRMHHDPEIYPDPKRFYPERFSLENQAKRHNFAYVPFSAGPRNCIGYKFATLEMKATMVKVIKNFELLPVPGFKEILGFTGVIKSKNGACVRLNRRY